MQLSTYEINGSPIAEVHADNIIINNAGDATDLIGNLYFQGFEKVILHELNIDPAFFDLKSGIAGDILQKFTNYRMKLAIVGDFSKFNSKSLKDFIFESNRQKQINFVANTEDALQALS